MEKNVRLADIYIKIYNKQPLLMDDLAFLAKYDKECFEKTCRNLIYNIPEAKELLKPAESQKNDGSEPKNHPKTLQEQPKEQTVLEEVSAENTKEDAQDVQTEIGALLENLKKMEWQEMPIPNLDADKVKSLLGNLYMEMLFPHNDRYRYFNLAEGAHSSIFNRKV